MQAAVLHAVGVGNRPFGKRCYPRAGPRGRCPYWWPLLPAATLAGDSPSCGATPCRLAAGSHHLRPSYGRCLH
ncbi:hypothetical protein GW17_00061940, partial [Ensete ventricosum]